MGLLFFLLTLLGFGKRRDRRPAPVTNTVSRSVCTDDVVRSTWMTYTTDNDSSTGLRCSNARKWSSLFVFRDAHADVEGYEEVFEVHTEQSLPFEELSRRQWRASGQPHDA
jgi:hypothetical protein